MMELTSSLLFTVSHLSPLDRLPGSGSGQRPCKVQLGCGGRREYRRTRTSHRVVRGKERGGRQVVQGRGKEVRIRLFPCRFYIISSHLYILLCVTFIRVHSCSSL